MVDSAWVAAGAACAAGAAAWVAAINGSRTLARARRDSRDRSRPMLAAELRDVPYATASQALVIRNAGATIARNVEVTFQPPIPDPEPAMEASSVTPFLKRRYAKPIPVLTPGMELDNLWYVGEAYGNGYVNSEPTPDKVDVHLSYDAPDGTRYSDVFPLDVDLLRKRTYSTSSSSPEEQAKEAVKALKAIQHAVTKLASRR